MLAWSKWPPTDWTAGVRFAIVQGLARHSVQRLSSHSSLTQWPVEVPLLGVKPMELPFYHLNAYMACNCGTTVPLSLSHVKHFTDARTNSSDWEYRRPAEVYKSLNFPKLWSVATTSSCGGKNGVWLRHCETLHQFLATCCAPGYLSMAWTHRNLATATWRLFSGLRQLPPDVAGKSPVT